MREAGKDRATPAGWRATLTDAEQRIADIDPLARISAVWFDEDGVMRLQASCPATARKEVNRSLRRYESDLLGCCELCGHQGRVRSGVILTVRCDDRL